MKKTVSQSISFVFVFLIVFLILFSFAGCGLRKTSDYNDLSLKYSSARVLFLDEDNAYLDGEKLNEYDYTWHMSPDREGEWFEGEEPEETDAYIAHDIRYYPQLDVSGFSKEEYDGETEWVYHYTIEGLSDCIFSTLPCFMSDETIPVEMMHSEKEAYANKVLHITKPGDYILSGKWHGQILVDLGKIDEAFTDEAARVNIVLNNSELICDCAPALIFKGAYECDNEWKIKDKNRGNVDTYDAGVNIIIADGSENNIKGSGVYTLLKPSYKNENSGVQKKAYKTDGAIYSFVSMNIFGDDVGTGILNVTSAFEGIDSELHFSIYGGHVNIYAQDDGINVNEDGVSVFAMNGGTLHIFAGLGREGDCIDSNGYIVVNGGLIAGGTLSGSDELLDSNNGKIINGGQVINVGSGQSTGFFAPYGMESLGPEGFNKMQPPLGGKPMPGEKAVQ